MSQFFASGGQSTGASASASVLPEHIQDWFPLGLTGRNFRNQPQQERLLSVSSSPGWEPPQAAIAARVSWSSPSQSSGNWRAQITGGPSRWLLPRKDSWLRMSRHRHDPEVCLPGGHWKAKVLVTKWCQTLCNPMEYSPPDSSIHGILWAGILEWVAIPFSRKSSWPRKDWVFYKLITLYLVALDLCCWGWASHCSGFSCCRVQAQ